MIDISREELLSLAEAAEKLPARRNGSRPHASTLYRWAKHGLNGVRLEVLRVGDTTCTSVPALQSFFDRLTNATLEANQPAVSPTRRQGGVDRALDDMGV
jgi:hypothetical protein